MQMGEKSAKNVPTATKRSAYTARLRLAKKRSEEVNMDP